MKMTASVMAMSQTPTPPELPDMAPKSERTGLSVFLSLLVGLFVLSSAVSFLDDSLLAVFARQDLTVVRVLLMLLMLPVGLVAYLMMAVRPGIPKRIFLPVALFLPVSIVAVLPILIYFHEQALWVGMGVSFLQVLVAVFMIRWLQAGMKPSGLLVPASRIKDQPFRWAHFAGMILLALLVILPALLVYTAGSAKLAATHFSSGFVNLTPAGVIMEVREYTREDGKKITLVPMSHIGESTFYESLAASFPHDSVVLMEGVSDLKKTVKSSSNYSKMAKAIGVVEQQTAFKPQGEIVAADIDVSDFSPETLNLLKTSMLVHSEGITSETLPILMKPTPPGLEKRLMEDILEKRNKHLLKVLHERLPSSNHIIVPWGAAHMPGISREIEKSGFKVASTQPYMAIRFGF